MARFLKAILAGEDGVSMLEYGLMLGLLVAAALVAIGGMSSALNVKFTSFSTSLGG